MPALRERSDLVVVARRILQGGARRANRQISARGDGPAGALPVARQHPPARQRAAHRRRDGLRRGQITEAHLSDDFLEDARKLPPRSSVLQPARRAGAGAGAVHVAPPTVMVPASVAPSPRPVPRRPTRTLEEVEIDMIRAAPRCGRRQHLEASKRLGISRNTIYRKLRWNKAA